VAAQTGGTAVLIQGSVSGGPAKGGITFVRCTLAGGDGFDGVVGSSIGSAGGHGLYCVAIAATFHDCVITGGRAGDGTSAVDGLNATQAGRGIIITSTFQTPTRLLLSGTTVTGGQECDGPVAGFSGHAVACLADDGVVRLRDTTLTPGAVVGAGTAGLPIFTLGTIELYPEQAKSLELPALLGSGEAGEARLQGEQGDAVLLLAGIGPGYQQAIFKQGVVCVDLASLVAIPLGVLAEPSGELLVPFHMPALPAGFDHLLLVMQAAFAQGGDITLGDGSALLWCDG
jgi:hypothetical protein